MTGKELNRGIKLKDEMQETSDNLYLLQRALIGKEKFRGFKKYFFKCIGENEIHISAESISFGGVLKVDRKCMELIKDYFENKLYEQKKEFERLGGVMHNVW